MSDPIDHPDLAGLTAPELSEPERMRAAAMRLRRVADIRGLPVQVSSIVGQLSTALTLVSRHHEERGCAGGVDGLPSCLCSEIAAAVPGDES